MGKYVIGKGRGGSKLFFEEKRFSSGTFGGKKNSLEVLVGG